MSNVIVLVEFNFQAFSSVALLKHLRIPFDQADFYYIGPDVYDKYSTICNSLIFLGIDKFKINNFSYIFGNQKTIVQKIKNRISLIRHLNKLKKFALNKEYQIAFSSFITKDVKVTTPNKYLISLLKSNNQDMMVYEVSDGTRCIARNKGINPNFLDYKNILHKFISTSIYFCFGYKDNFINEVLIASPFNGDDVDIKLDLSQILINEVIKTFNENYFVNVFDMLLIGQPLSEVNIIESSKEIYYLRKIKEKFDNICYYPHAFDSLAKLELIEKLGFVVFKRDSTPFEIFLIKNNGNFKSLLTYNSTAICFAKFINPGIMTLSYDASNLISDYVDKMINLED